LFYFDLDRGMRVTSLSPANLHPAAASSFTEVLRDRIRSLLCMSNFGVSNVRAVRGCRGEDWRGHFAQTFPLHRRGRPTGAFHWLPADPRPGVEIDLRQVPVGEDPDVMARDWRRLEHAFGITEQERASREESPGRFRMYFCPTQDRWPIWRPRPVCTVDKEGEVWSRDELAHHLKCEAERWREMCLPDTGSCNPTLLKYDCRSREDVEMLEMMEQLPCTTIGMWLFPIEALTERKITREGTLCFDASAMKPGLFLFEV
jgi:hypothetical protein